MKCSADTLHVDIPGCQTRWMTVATADLVARFHRPEKFEALCRQCPRFAAQWCCPGLPPEAVEAALQHPRATVFISEIAVWPETPVAQADGITASFTRNATTTLLPLETTLSGRASCTIGRCPWCDNGPDKGICTRRQGVPCRYPRLVRPSLEALGFDLSAIATELFSTPLEWAQGAYLPPSLRFVTAVFHP